MNGVLLQRRRQLSSMMKTPDSYLNPVVTGAPPAAPGQPRDVWFGHLAERGGQRGGAGVACRTPDWDTKSFVGSSS